ncbi:hypothetical protein EJ05DRAFT_458127 [Pseudovirgaria hyperparasitica]|uniref:Pal1-domain-containing protein n=1 Tax=Pseudovirgaria hyperparasitica TaxID=470096 RepID=A0A6A6VU97_9PEZI|nr:uncharacterized protein EJ05DRAFT_458127 [Pseudovirgaria hyperparasitica]KAF2753190.1 hypothetical protein EJ05DRAFT_458127 [Pseudovirgaria hyperparasitica]
MGEDKAWAKAYVLDPLSGPDPSDETGPGSHFRSTYDSLPPSPASDSSKTPQVAVQTTGGSSSTNPFKRNTNSHSRASSNPSYPTPPSSTSPRREQFPVLPDHGSPSHLSPSQSHGRDGPSGHRRRGSSLNERYPGDPTVRPLDMLRKDTKRAHRAPHLRKANHIGPDLIDRLDPTMTYHHESPYDAASIARNQQKKYSPIAALESSNKEALKATPRENIQNAVQRHRPLEGVATVPPGMEDRFGRKYDYEEGSDMQRENGGDYKRWPGLQYHPNDLKGKSEPSYTIEKALKDHKARGGDVEMTSRARNKSLNHTDRPSSLNGHAASGIDRSNSTGANVTSALKQRLHIGRKPVTQN